MFSSLGRNTHVGVDLVVLCGSTIHAFIGGTHGWADPVALFHQYPLGISHPKAVSSQEFTGLKFLSSLKPLLANVNPAAMALKLAPFLISLGALLIVLSGFFFMLRAKRVATKLFLAGIGSVVVGSAAPDVLAPVISFVQSLPFWVIILLISFILLALLGAVASIIIGRVAAASMVGNLAADVVKGLFFLLIMPFRALRRLLGRYYDP